MAGALAGSRCGRRVVCQNALEMCVGFRSSRHAVEEICRRLDGIPLAIELAASRMASMTATEVRDRLDNRFKLLVGSRRGLERHQTLRHAVAWSYDLLHDERKGAIGPVFGVRRWIRPPKRLRGKRVPLMSSSPWICSTPWCASRCSSPIDRRGALGIRCWKRSASSLRNNSPLLVRPPRLGPLMPATSPGSKATSWLCGTALASARHTHGLPRKLANLRNAFRWAADHDDLDTAATIATFVGLIAFLAENYEPTSWAEELHRSRPRR